MIILPKIISDIYQKFSGEEAYSVVQLPPTASDRLYYRITGISKQSFIVTHSANVRENKSFVNLSKHFASHNLNVPQILHVEPDYTTYIQEDLGDTTLFSLLQNNNISNNICKLYYEALEQLVRFQFEASSNLNFSHCYPVEAFDKQSMMWDMNYFKYYFLKPSNIHFEEDLLEKDFQTLTDYLLQKKHKTFMFRDFQSRNIMIHNDKIYLIDYQGGRRGPYLYDLASCILDAKADLPADFSANLIATYYNFLPIKHQRVEFDKEFKACKLIRILQTFGAYGFRGMIQKKTLFLQSIPYAAANMKQLLREQMPFELPHLNPVLEAISEKYMTKPQIEKSDKLTVRVFSFSYKKGIPEDSSTNGGGFVFDCRSLLNPGRIAELQFKTGIDSEVSAILVGDNSVKDFLSHASKLVAGAIDSYLSRGFSDLMVSFGCTGGQHRSVFCAKALFDFLTKKYPSDKVVIKLVHREFIN